MDGASHELLAGPAFAGDQHVAARGRHLADRFEYPFHHGGFTDNLADVEPSVQLFFQLAVLGLQFEVAHLPLDPGQHLVEVDRLHDVVAGAQLDRFDRHFDRAVRGHHHHAHLRPDRLSVAQDRYPVGPGHLDIEDGQKEGTPGDGVESLIARAHGRDGPTLLPQDLRKGLSKRGLVVGQQDFVSRFGHRRLRGCSPPSSRVSLSHCLSTGTSPRRRIADQNALRPDGHANDRRRSHIRLGLQFNRTVHLSQQIVAHV